MAGSNMPLAVLLRHLDRLANESLSLWDLPKGAQARLINVSENATYLVEASDGFKAVLRVHRADYHSRRAIECELAWTTALDASGTVITPVPYPGKDGQAIQEATTEGLADLRHMVLFHFVEGSPPDKKCDLMAEFEGLGEIAARMHTHSANWKRPANFERLTWDLEQFFGAIPTWGDWRDAPGVDEEVRVVLEQVQTTVSKRLESFGRGPDRYGLIHADMRCANLLKDANGTRLIDFDDCGMSWFLYDFATGISFMEEDPRVPSLKAAWVKGYRKLRPLLQAEEAEIDTFVMLRRMALLAWIGSHIEVPESQTLAPGFAAVTAEIGRAYLARFG